ncbi:hypothetical protein GCM10023166_36050 [Paeniglutamicibacter cryotolerans]
MLGPGELDERPAAGGILPEHRGLYDGSSGADQCIMRIAIQDGSGNEDHQGRFQAS